MAKNEVSCATRVRKSVQISIAELRYKLCSLFFCAMYNNSAPVIFFAQYVTRFSAEYA